MISRALLLPFLACPLLLASQAEPTVTGTVVDAHGKPVAGATICSQWGPPDGTRPPFALGPLGITDAKGHFAPVYVEIRHTRAAFMVYDSLGTHGAMVDLPASDIAKPVKVQLHQLHPVHWKLRTEAPIDLKRGAAHLSTTTGAVVAALSGNQGAALLPPGHYELLAATEDTGIATQTFTVADQELTLPALDLPLSPMAQHFGHGTPELVPLRDINQQTFEIGPLRGRWTLLYFWADWCLPCIREGIPQLIAFQNSHAASASQFRIVAVHENNKNETGDWNDFHAKTLKLEADLWHTVPPFPLVYDDTTQMTSSWDILSFPTYALIDPEGNLVRGADLKTLETALNQH